MGFEKYIDQIILMTIQIRLMNNNVMIKQMTKDKCAIVDKQLSYHKYFILDGKKLDIENFDYV